MQSKVAILLLRLGSIRRAASNRRDARPFSLRGRFGNLAAVVAVRRLFIASGIPKALARARVALLRLSRTHAPQSLRSTKFTIVAVCTKLAEWLGLRAAFSHFSWIRLVGFNHFYRVAYRLAQGHTRFIARFAKPLADPAWTLATGAVTASYMLLLANGSRSGPRLVTRMLPRFARHVHLAILSIELASGHSERALKLARTLNLMHRNLVRQRAAPSCNLYFESLFRTMRFDRIVYDVPQPEIITDHHLNHMAGVAHLYALNAGTAIYFLQRAISIHDGSYIDYRMLGRAYLLNNEIEKAKSAFQRSVELKPMTVMAHQNYAGRYDISNYVPKSFELSNAGSLLVYDNLGQFSEDLFLQGRFKESFRNYQRMLDYQRELGPTAKIPNVLIRRLAQVSTIFDTRLPIRLLPYEWVVQFGHIGLLDIYMKMAKLGMYPKANYVLLAPENKVANQAYLRYWERYFTIVRDQDLVDELFPYQRYIGDNFMAYPSDTGEAEPWTQAGARAQVQWAAENRDPLLTLSAEDRALGLAKLAELRVPDGAWYVGLHVREGGFYVEASTGMSTHRNASINDYLGAIRTITERGGWVIRLGDDSMRPMPPMPQVIDYAVSRHKSPEMDIFLLATSRFVIGTTSGLTTACLSFGRPMVLVNCISNDWQLWTAQTDFILKRLRDKRSQHYLSLSETYRQPIQGYLINNVVTNRRGLSIESNSADEITEAVTYKLDCLDGVTTRPSPAHPTRVSYLREMAKNPFMFGAAQPVPEFLERNASLLGKWAPAKATAAPMLIAEKTVARG